MQQMFCEICRTPIFGSYNLQTDFAACGLKSEVITSTVNVLLYAPRVLVNIVQQAFFVLFAFGACGRSSSLLATVFISARCERQTG